MLRGPRSLERWLIGICATAITAGGCAPGGDPARTASPAEPSTIVVTPEPLPGGLHLSFIQQRIDEGTDKAGVRVINGHRARVLWVRGVAISWPGYPAAPLRHRSYPVPPQQIIDLPYLLPDPKCAPRVLDRPAYGVVRLPHGTQRRRLQPDGVRFLTRIWRTACDRRALDHALGVRLVLGRRMTRDPSGAPQLVSRVRLVRRQQAGPVTVTAAEGSVLFDLSLMGRRTVPADEQRASIPLRLGPGRCDEHARSQATQPFHLQIWVRLGTGGELAAELPVTPAGQRTLLRFLAQACRGVTSH